MKISMQEIEKLMTNDPIDSVWRKVLKEGYEPDEYYFEFGLFPKYLKEYDNFEIILNHSFPVRLKRTIEENSSSSVITADILNNQGKSKYLVDADTLDIFFQEATMIFHEYRKSDGGAFFSIPNKWFSDTQLVQFISEKIHPEGMWARADWYWP